VFVPEGGGVAGFRSIVLAALLAAVACSAFAADAPGTITILEGDAQIFRAASRYVAAEGVRLYSGDIVETGDHTFMQIELADQSSLQLGGISRVMINAGRGKNDHWVYFMNGWAKLSGMRRDPKGDGAFEMRAPLFELPPSQGVVVMLATPIEVQLFVERGQVRLSERQRGAAPAPLTLNGGDTYRRKVSSRGSVERGADVPDFLAKMPRSFRDTLPSRLEKFRERDVRPREAPDFGYADVELWLKAEPAIRRPFVQRWKAKAFADAAFKQGIVANMSAHPEWDPVLFPEKYLPKEPPSATPAQPAQAQTGSPATPSGPTPAQARTPSPPR
jgi:hypothetical protein